MVLVFILFKLCNPDDEQFSYVVEITVLSDCKHDDKNATPINTWIFLSVSGVNFTYISGVGGLH